MTRAQVLTLNDLQKNKPYAEWFILHMYASMWGHKSNDFLYFVHCVNK